MAASSVTLAPVRIARRSILRLMALAAGSAPFLHARVAEAGESALGVHRATRNTLLGAIGDGLRQVRSPLAPYKAYAGLPRIALAMPQADGESLTSALARRAGTAAATPDPKGQTGKLQNRSLDRDRLGRLLYFTNGDTGRGDGDPYRLRAAPSAGALYAGEIYVIALDVAGLDRGVYYYDVGGHELVRTAEAPANAELSAAFERMSVTGAAALFCVTNVFERYEIRYANRGYRYALIDTGHIAENLLLESAALGIPAHALPRFEDDQLSRFLGVDGNDEAPCWIGALGGEIAAMADVSGGFVEKAVAGLQVTTEPDAPLRYHDATRLVPGRPRRKAHEHRRADRLARTGAERLRDERVELPDAAATAVPLETCIAARRSPSAFAQRALTAAQLAAVLRTVRPRATGSAFVDVLLFAHRVEGIRAGLYMWMHDEDRLAVVREDDFTESLPRVCLGQSKAGDAAAGILCVAHLREAAARDGERSYRDLLIEAGGIAQRVYLAAEALGLSARNLAAFLDDDLDELVGIDGRDRASIHLTMVGYRA